MRDGAAGALASLACLLLLCTCTPAAAAPPAPRYWGDDPTPMTTIAAGSFLMGSVAGAPDETPVFDVFLHGYAIDRTEVTNRQYRLFEQWMSKTRDHTLCSIDEPARKDHVHRDFGPDYAAPEQPVVGVDWFDAMAYANWAGKRLPTEAEWERAARGNERWAYPWGFEIDASRANYGGTLGRPSPIGRFPGGISPTGCLDMAGNVWEWCYDWYDARFYQSRGPGPIGPSGPLTGERRVLRGGSWTDFASTVRASFRGSAEPLVRADHIGFRCVR